MIAKVAALLAMAARYLDLAKATTDAVERDKLQRYAALYRDMAEQARTEQTSAAISTAGSS